jgi:hypothetical protein
LNIFELFSRPILQIPHFRYSQSRNNRPRSSMNSYASVNGRRV